MKYWDKYHKVTCARKRCKKTFVKRQSVKNKKYCSATCRDYDVQRPKTYR